MTLAAILVALAVVLLVLQPWPGAIVLSFASDHGIDLGDVPSLVLLVAACAVIGGTPDLARARAGLARFRSSRLGDLRLAGAGCGAVLLVTALAQVVDRGHQARLVAAGMSIAAATALVWLAIAAGSRALAPAALFLIGALVDARATPSGTLFAPMLAALAIGTRRSRLGRLTLWGVAASCAVASLASIRDLWGIDVPMASSDGGPARTASLGVVLIVAGTGARPYSGTTLKSSKRAPDGPVEIP